jgi:flavin reductase (DIM6/NTAB) family NADH-FMN oxidoreductase RutF
MKEREKGISDLYPNPVVLVSTEYDGKESIITLGWVGTICSNPPMVSISIRPSRFSHNLVKKSREFVINIPTTKMLEQIEICGTQSGKNTDKWKKCSFTKQPSDTISVPVIAECPVNMECKVTQIISLGSHDMFIAEVMKIQRDTNWDKMDGQMVVFTRGFYGKVDTIK